MNTVERIAALGQRIWYDNISRDLLGSGRLKALVAAGVRGVTTNPTIFEKAVRDSSQYDDDLRRLREAGTDPGTWVRALMVADVRQAADILRPVYDRSLGEDGYVSIEVDPHKAYDTDATIAEAALLWREVARPNVMIKIPGTPPGLAAVRQTVRAGINVNVTLLFSPSRYDEAANAYLAALDDRLKDGQTIDRVASVASVFVSRVDTEVDALLKARIQTAPTAEAKRLQGLMGRAGSANAQRIYQRYKDIFRSKGFARLRARGARPQWPLWASTSTKDPALSPVWYIDRLIAPDTINTVPPVTFDALTTHGRPRALLEAELPQAQGILDSLRREGIDIGGILDQLAVRGVEAFTASFESLAQQLAAKQAALAQA
ncbi:MAG: transaldolase [Gammaproteobacteria bacterium]|nr:transaldolase [Gammaproteobacteria bacterium]